MDRRDVDGGVVPAGPHGVPGGARQGDVLLDVLPVGRVHLVTTMGCCRGVVELGRVPNATSGE